MNLCGRKACSRVSTEGFGAPGYLRLSFARPMPELEDGVQRIAGFLAGLRGN